MKEDSNSSFKGIFKKSICYGLIFGTIILLINVLDYFMGFHEQNHLFNNIKYLIRILGLLVCVLIFRKHYGQYISFDTIFSFSLLTFVFAMVFYDAVTCVIYNIFPDALYNKIDSVRERLLTSGASLDLVEKSINSTLWVKNPYYIIVTFLIWVLFVGPLVSLVCAIMLQRKPPKSDHGELSDTEIEKQYTDLQFDDEYH